ncbi:MAG: hypothetical protein U0Y82_15920 [Thermoleophilia bacterium]
MDDGPDLGEAVDFILAERPRLDEEHVWAVVNELGVPPAKGGDDLAVTLLAGTHPGIGAKTVRLVLKEWRAYARLASEPDWDDI